LSVNTWRSGPEICSLICGWKVCRKTKFTSCCHVLHWNAGRKLNSLDPKTFIEAETYHFCFWKIIQVTIKYLVLLVFTDQMDWCLCPDMAKNMPFKLSSSLIRRININTEKPLWLLPFYVVSVTCQIQFILGKSMLQSWLHINHLWQIMSCHP
jgi:hypothetical protein